MKAPTLHVTNWSSTTLHGPGRQLTIMARPRPWEWGDGRVAALTPDPFDLDAARAGRLSVESYRTRFIARVEPASIRPGRLPFDRAGALHFVADGDTLLCACGREAAARGECHRVWAAGLLRLAGWRVVLDGDDGAEPAQGALL